MKKIVFLTGATGQMGMETVKKFMENVDEFTLRVLARESETNKKKLAPFDGKLEIIWGDLKDDEKLAEGVKDADYVLHVGALVSPFADEEPEEAMRINYGSTLSMLKSIKDFGQQDKTHFVYIGTVAMTGDRMPPIHWGRVGDPLKPSIYDYYAISKCFSERAVIESGLKYWTSIRQTGMAPVNPSSGEYPIISHQPYNNCLEWSNAEDSGNLMRNVCLDTVPDQFWRRVYNLSGGADYRQTCYTFSASLGSDLRDIYEPNWMAAGNFHGQFYTDADELQELVPFRTKSFAEVQKEYLQKMASMIEAAGPGFAMPTKEQQKAKTKEIISRPGGVLQFVADHDEERINVWFGSKEKYEAIPKSWNEIVISIPCDSPRKLDHGFDETKPAKELDIDDMQQAAKFRGGECLSRSMEKGSLYAPLKWKCAFGHEFAATPYLILFAGHWCRECDSKEWKYGEIADVNPFFAQVWKPLHKGEKNFRVKMAADVKKVETLYK
ncbi:NAD-dependent epimerase/dehydratase family protein [Lacrimispora sp. JR3]|uniref:NAD-dependent epimerase/dehydratase family protein n=1 Tax=Lacrimispora sinapis TaxID=3111456 RepID=UPI00374A2490